MYGNDSLVLIREDEVPQNCMHRRYTFDEYYPKESMYCVQLLMLVIYDVSDILGTFLASLSCDVLTNLGSS
jgi:hypothetical protein